MSAALCACGKPAVAFSIRGALLCGRCWSGTDLSAPPWPKHLSGGCVVLPPGSPVCSGDKWLHSDGRVEPMDGGGNGGTFLVRQR